MVEMLAWPPRMTSITSEVRRVGATRTEWGQVSLESTEHPINYLFHRLDDTGRDTGLGFTQHLCSIDFFRNSNQTVQGSREINRSRAKSRSPKVREEPRRLLTVFVFVRGKKKEKYIEIVDKGFASRAEKYPSHRFNLPNLSDSFENLNLNFKLEISLRSLRDTELFTSVITELRWVFEVASRERLERRMSSIDLFGATLSDDFTNHRVWYRVIFSDCIIILHCIVPVRF